MRRLESRKNSSWRKAQGSWGGLKGVRVSFESPGAALRRVKRGREEEWEMEQRKGGINLLLGHQGQGLKPFPAYPLLLHRRHPRELPRDIKVGEGVREAEEPGSGTCKGVLREQGCAGLLTDPSGLRSGRHRT